MLEKFRYSKDVPVKTSYNRIVIRLLALSFLCILWPPAAKADSATIGLTITNQQKVLRLPILPATDSYKILTSTNLGGNFLETKDGLITGFNWTAPMTGNQEFYRVQTVPLAPDALLRATVLNRLAYGSTPDELTRLSKIGADAYIQEQLAPENIQETLSIDESSTGTGWRRVTMTGTASSADLYLYLEGVGDVYLDDVSLVSGSVAETGVNRILNGTFEAAVSPAWTISTNLTDSSLSTEIKHGGASSLHMVTSSSGSTRGSSIWQTMTGVTSGQTYTLSYWWHPGTNAFPELRLRLSGSGISSTPLTIRTRLDNEMASIDDLRAWHILRAVRSQKQLLEVMTQFLENHFVTHISKSREYLDRTYNDGSQIDKIATSFEFKENQRWRVALQKPLCTFSNLLTISAESPAMIVYLDTVDSKGNGSNIANENYARDLLELFTMGVDNGYDQTDITTLSRCWTGWSVDILNRTNEFNPLAPRSTVFIPGATNTATANLVGVWSFRYKSANHNTASKILFPSKVVPSRFGAPYAGRPYSLTIPARPAATGIQDGYQVIGHLSDLPFTQEYISVKLCQLFVHEDFEIGYDFTDPNLSPEGQLVYACMKAWETNMPKGQIRKVLNTIFSSQLFRGNDGSNHKVKTPLEFTVAAIRALRSTSTNGTMTAETDGYSIPTTLNRMGSMRLFQRAEPDGYTEFAPGWISAGTLAERLRFVQSFCMAAGATGKTEAGAANTVDPVALLKKNLPTADWSKSDVVARYFVALLFPGEGRANLDHYSRLAAKFLNTADDGVAVSLFSATTLSAANYDTRVRGMVGTLMTLPRYQEQ